MKLGKESPLKGEAQPVRLFFNRMGPQATIYMSSVPKGKSNTGNVLCETRIQKVNGIPLSGPRKREKKSSVS